MHRVVVEWLASGDWWVVNEEKKEKAKRVLACLYNLKREKQVKGKEKGMTQSSKGGKSQPTKERWLEEEMGSVVTRHLDLQMQQIALVFDEWPATLNPFYWSIFDCVAVLLQAGTVPSAYYYSHVAQMDTPLYVIFISCDLFLIFSRKERLYILHPF